LSTKPRLLDSTLVTVLVPYPYYRQHTIDGCQTVPYPSVPFSFASSPKIAHHGVLYAQLTSAGTVGALEERLTVLYLHPKCKALEVTM
jgi:hypothetical protein